MSRYVKYVIQIRIHRFSFMEGFSGRLHTLDDESIIKESVKSHMNFKKSTIHKVERRKWNVTT